MPSHLEEQFMEYWTDRIPGSLEFAREILNSDTDLRYTLGTFLRDRENNKILDMGTGVGVIAIELALMGHKVQGMDNNPEVLRAARSLADEYGADVGFIEGDVQDPSFIKERYDVIVARNCLWNLEEPARAYSKWKELLNPGG